LHGQASTVCGSMLQNIPHTGRNVAAVANCEYTCGLCTQNRPMHVVVAAAAAAATPIQ